MAEKSYSLYKIMHNRPIHYEVAITSQGKYNATTHQERGFQR